jgi:hypothetical protein
MELNEGQIKSIEIIKNFLNLNLENLDNLDNLNNTNLDESKNINNRLLLLGPGGSGKTTVIVNAFNEYPNLKIAFCAFTNKATQVLYNISNKFNIKFQADFLTIHKLLMLEPKINNKEVLEFNFSINKLDNVREYDIIIFDECSTINKELYGYIEKMYDYIYEKYGINLKYIFIGDFWQLPPIFELNSIVFQKAVSEKWTITKLNQVMRANNEHMFNINNNLLNIVNNIKAGKNEFINAFRIEYPKNILNKYKNILYDNYEDLINNYIDKIKYEESSVILTYTNANCQKINYMVQDKIDLENNREITDREIIWFYKNDRCCLDKPINVMEIKECNPTSIEEIKFKSKKIRKSNILDFETDNFEIENKEIENKEIENKEKIYKLDGEIITTIYNGEIFIILNTEFVNIHTEINKYLYKKPYFKGQILYIKKLGLIENIYKILYIPENYIKEAKTYIYNNKKWFYRKLFREYNNFYPKINYGYCITLYKSQGSEWNTVYINLNSIYYSIINNKDNDISIKEKTKLLFKSSYTAMTRASHNLYILWMN